MHYVYNHINDVLPSYRTIIKMSFITNIDINLK